MGRLGQSPDSIGPQPGVLVFGHMGAPMSRPAAPMVQARFSLGNLCFRRSVWLQRPDRGLPSGLKPGPEQSPLPASLSNSRTLETLKATQFQGNTHREVELHCHLPCHCLALGRGCHLSGPPAPYLKPSGWPVTISKATSALRL